MSDTQDDLPLDDEDARVRPYVMTSGRRQDSHVQLDLISIVIAANTAVDEVSLEPEQLSILAMCGNPLSVAEVSAHLGIPVAVVKVLLGDLVGRGYVLARAPQAKESPVARDVLQAVLEGIQRL